MSRYDEKRFLETSRGTLDYITIDLINQISRHPALWKRQHQDFKSSEAKIEAWHAIGRVFVPFYDDVDADEQENIIESLKNRWNNCVKGLMTAVTLKRKNDRRFCPFKYTREMRFYLETRSMQLSDIYDEQENCGIEEIQIKNETEIEEDEDELMEETDEEYKDEEVAPQNKKNKTADTSVTYRSARLREKQTVLEKSSPEKKSNTPKNKKQIQIKTTPLSINGSICYSLEKSNSSMEENNEEVLPNNSTPQQKIPKTLAAVNHSVNSSQNGHITSTFSNESEAADQAFFDSIKPALQKMNETQKLDFQIDILQILKTVRTN